MKPLRITSLTHMDALIAEHVTGETPVIRWEDAHAYFSFATEAEALEALRDPYYQLFLPQMDWTTTVVHKVNTYRSYSTDLNAAWEVLEKLSAGGYVMQVWKDQGKWSVAIGDANVAVARTPPLAICLSALRAKGLKVEIDTDTMM